MIMSEAVYIQYGEDLTRMELDFYSRENDFQKLLESFPDLLAGDQVNPSEPRRWLLVKREAAIPSREGGNDRWSLDHLFIDQDAIPTLVEVKRKSDTRLRREVVGQMMDYAANAVAYWPGDTLIENFCETQEALGEDPEEVLTEFLQEEEDPLDSEEFWQQANENLRNGNVRLIFVADRIPHELQRIVEFMNERMSPTEVLALELRRYSGGAFSTHIPRVLGQTAAAQIAKRDGIPAKASKQRRTWTEERFFDKASSRLSPPQVANIRKVLNFCKASTFDKIVWGTGNVSGSFSPKCLAISKRAPITIRSGGRLDLKLSWLTDTETAIIFRDKLLKKIEHARLPINCQASLYKKIPMSKWEVWIDQFLDVLECAAQETLAETKTNTSLNSANIDSEGAMSSFPLMTSVE
jgi:hypothetical protein